MNMYNSIFELGFRIKSRLQPIVDLASDACVAYEVLSTIVEHNDPESFFSGLHHDSLFLLVKNQINILNAMPKLQCNTSSSNERYYINVSPDLLASEENIKWLCKHSEKFLTLEIDFKSMAFTDVNIPISSIKILEEHGHEIWLDDFDGDVSSPAFTATQWHGVKVDKSILWEFGMNFTALSRLAHKIRCHDSKLLIEGIETKQQRDICRSAGFEFGQGFFWKDLNV